MPIFLLNDEVAFPPPELADDESGILAVGGDLSVARLLLAYSIGVFPWYDQEASPILWHAPAWRMVLEPAGLHRSRSLRKALRRTPLELRWDSAFERVMDHCARVPRPGQDGTWLNDDMRQAYLALHRRGFAHSAEAWRGDTLVGGLYGVTLGGAFFGESMFSLETDASKIVFARTVEALTARGYTLIDCQVYTDHLASLGAVEWPRARFSEALAEALRITPDEAWPRQPRPAASAPDPA
ncbi:MAG: leucyl/phenylalanyl-tRNA--protein transferase [Myxococcales bacterium]|nr:leucyl/phenylalanyl-tRNA--protein transferase [Myxococcales bacterium]